MSTIEATYCSQADMQFVLPSIDEYDMKRVLPTNWVESGTSNLYNLHNAGYVSILFKDGQDLGSEQGSEPSSNNQWRYVEGDDKIEFFLSSSSTSALNSIVFEVGRDFSDLITECRKRGSDFTRNLISKPIYARKGVGTQSSVANDYPEVIVMIAAHLACYFLVNPYNKELASELYGKVSNIDGNGWADKINRGEMDLYQEDSNDAVKGILREVTYGGSSTGGINAIRGIPTCDWDAIKIIIESGDSGTFTAGSASSVKYTTYLKNDTGLKISKHIDSEVMEGSYQQVGHGMYVRFAPGVYSANDEWELEVSAPEYLDQSSASIKYAYNSRIA